MEIDFILFYLFIFFLTMMTQKELKIALKGMMNKKFYLKHDKTVSIPFSKMCSEKHIQMQICRKITFLIQLL